ncbi:MAG: hypothetical protein LBU84_11335 [Prevotella sp.]|jgi:hypothetical protein|nr:hypothetical protein [Prevotella sp.]
MWQRNKIWLIRVFSFLKLKQLELFNSQALGELFFPEGLDYAQNKATCISLKHGRSIAIQKDAFEWILIKGGGWTWGGPLVYRSVKDEQLVFGLYSTQDAIREIAVSRKLEEISDNFPKVLYYKSFKDYMLPDEFDFLHNTVYSDNTPVNPCLLYTQVKSPLRIADLQFLNDNEKQEVLTFYSSYFKSPQAQFVEIFAEKLGEHIGLMHMNNFINDSLDNDNITLAAEITDYEWVTAPGIPFPDGSYGDIIPNERKEKEILYALEAVLFLSSILRFKIGFYEIFECLIQGYRKSNASFITHNENINKIIARAKYII